MLMLPGTWRPQFRTSDGVRKELKQLCAAHADVARYRCLGRSEAGRDIDAVILGRGDRTVSLIGGAHPDEPVGPETLRTLVIEGLKHREQLEPLLDQCRLVIVPHINPDGEDMNQRWIREWPSLAAYVQHVHRDLPGRDLEFGFPAMRPENRILSGFLKQYAPFQMHMSLHGMAFAEGAFLLIDRHWLDRTESLREAFAIRARDLGMGLHDHDRGGEKGFLYIGPGFTTTPRGEAMREHFSSLGDKDTALLFHDSSMEFVRRLGGDPLCLVTELPIFDLREKRPRDGQAVPATYLEVLAELGDMRRKAAEGDDLREEIKRFGISPLPLRKAIGFHLYTIRLGLEATGLWPLTRH